MFYNPTGTTNISVTPGTATTSHSTVNPSTTLLECKDDNGQTFCNERKHKCDKQHIMEKCRKTCGLCHTTNVSTTSSTTISMITTTDTEISEIVTTTTPIITINTSTMTTGTSITSTTTIKTTTKYCAPERIGDGVCDDTCNNLNNGFDGGDCCPPSVDTTNCSECRCLDPEHSTTTTATTITPRNCVAGWVGDNFCDDECNNIDNSFDGGDCCGPNAVFSYCSECQCHEG